MKKPFKVLLFILFIIIVLLILYFFEFEKLTSIENIVEFKNNFVQNNKFIIFFSVLGMYFLFSFLFLTIAPLSILSGILFDKILGAFLAFLGSNITMIISFLISRFFFNSFFIKLKEKNKLLKNILDNLSNNGKQYLLFARLFFITPYNALNIVCGISDIKIKDYIIYSLLGCIPSTIFYAYCGSVINRFTDYQSIKTNAIITAIVVGFFFALVFILRKLFTKKFLKSKS